MPLSPNRKQQIKRKVSKQARREYRPQIRAARKNVSQLKKQRERDLASVPEAATYLRNALNDAMGEAQDSRLKGRYLQDTLGELTAMKGDAARMVPLEQRAVRQEYANPLSSARSQLTGLKVDRANAEQAAYEKVVTQRRTAQAEQRQDTAEAKGEKREQVKLAENEIKRLLSAYGPASIPKTEQQWAAFAGEVAKAEGIKDPYVVDALIARMRRNAVSAGAMGVGSAAAGVIKPKE